MGRRVRAERRGRQFPVRVLDRPIRSDRGRTAAAVRGDDATAKTDLHLIAPLKYYVANQPKNGDRHVYGARSRFLTKAVMAQFERTAWPPVPGRSGEAPVESGARIDVAAQLRGMW